MVPRGSTCRVGGGAGPSATGGPLLRNQLPAWVPEAGVLAVDCQGFVFQMVWAMFTCRRSLKSVTTSRSQGRFRQCKSTGRYYRGRLECSERRYKGTNARSTHSLVEPFPFKDQVLVEVVPLLKSYAVPMLSSKAFVAFASSSILLCLPVTTRAAAWARGGASASVCLWRACSCTESLWQRANRERAELRGAFLV